MLTKTRAVAFAVCLSVCAAAPLAQRPAAPAARQDAERAAAVKGQVRKMTRAFVEEDFETLLDGTYSKALELAGGRARMVETLKAGVAEGRARGAKIVCYEPGEPGRIKRARTKLLTVVPVEMKIDFPALTFTQKSFLLGVSSDGGKVWKFIDGTSLNQAQLKLLVPEAVGVMTLPKAEEPLIERKP